MMLSSKLQKMAFHIYVTYNISKVDLYDLADSRRSYKYLNSPEFIQNFMSNHRCNVPCPLSIIKAN